MRGTRTHARSIPVTGQREPQQRVASNIPTQEGERKKDTQSGKSFHVAMSNLPSPLETLSHLAVIGSVRDVTCSLAL
ncbi:hypothetical protein EVAR_84002_1 [Eumeta japonica]|uniref:Uncharacterized protein n=1 Tax=Eumeta variegata TaxID=151549 RepID=A0A4C1X995_EUMVA|nr:hypothetical protein EVAR_84002_1 [Eumeta japonica]